MKITRLISAICAAALFAGSFSAVGLAEEIPAVVSVKENFNNLVNGSVPDGFNTKEAGDVSVGVVPKPDSVNKSLYLRSTASGSAFVEFDAPNPNKNGLTLSFRFMLPKACDLAVPTIVDNNGKLHNIVSVSNMKLCVLDEECANVVSGVWHTMQVRFDFAKLRFRVLLDGIGVVPYSELPLGNVTAVRFELTDSQSEIYIDDISMGITVSDNNAAREYYPSELYLTDDQYAQAEDLMSGAIAMHKGSHRININGVLGEMSTSPIEEDKVLYTPLRSTAEALGSAVEWNSADGSVTVKKGERVCVLNPGSGDVSIDSSAYTLSAPVLSANGSTYIAAGDIPLVFEKQVFVNDWFIYIGGDPAYLQETDDIVFDEVVNVVRYPRPTGEEMLSALIGLYPNKTHPRLFATAADFERLRGTINNDSFASKCFAYLKAQAENMIDDDLPEYAVDAGGIRFDNPAREDVSNRIETMALMWKLTGDEQYAQRAWKDMEHMCVKFPDWNPPHILDIGYIGMAVAIGYDWCYDWLNDSQKATIRKALVEKAINVGLSVYRGNHGSTTRTFWAADEFNWNPTVNAAMLAAALAVCDEDSETSVPTLAYVLRSLEFHLGEFDPDGGWQEGPGYGSGTLYSDSKILSLLDVALGSDYEISNVTNILGGCYYQLYMLGPEGLFNYGDANQTSYAPFRYEFYFAKKLGDKSIGYHRKTDIESRYFACDPLELVWYDPAYIGDSIQLTDIDKYFRKSEVIVMRSGWEDDAMFAGFMGGDNEASHSHYDTGNFVLDWNGTRWVADYGMNQSSYDTSEGYSLYTLRAEGHNTITIDDTPYIPPVPEDEWQTLSSFSFDDIEEGGQPDLSINESAGIPGEETGKVRVQSEPTEDNLRNKVLRVSCPKAESGFQAFPQLLIAEPYPTTGVELEFKILFENLDYTNSMPSLCDSERTSFSMLQFRPEKESKILAVDGDSMITVGPYQANEWYSFRARLDFKSKTYDLYMNDKLVKAGLKFKADLKDLYYIRYQLSAKKTAFRLDDFTVRVHPDDAGAVEGTRRAHDQVEKSKAYIDHYESKNRGAYAISDITEAYSRWAESAVRGVMLSDNRTSFVVRDEIKLKSKADVYWFSHHLKEIKVEISPDGKSAVMTDKNGNRMWVGILSDVDAKIELRDCTPLASSPNPAVQVSSLTRYDKLSIKFEGVDSVNMSVAFVPLLNEGNMPANIPEEKPLNDWTIPDGKIPAIDTITLDGKEIEGFKPSKTVYSIALRDDEKLPVVEAYADGVKIDVVQPASAPGTATFKYFAGGVEAEFSINFTVRKVVRSFIQGYPISEDGITTSSVQQENNPPKATIDGVDTTRWAASGKGEWIIFDFEQEHIFSALDVGWYLGEKRKYDFEILLSTDGANWTSVFKGNNSGTTGSAETYTFAPQSARYIKIIGNGSNENLWNNIAEVR